MKYLKLFENFENFEEQHHLKVLTFSITDNFKNLIEDRSWVDELDKWETSGENAPYPKESPEPNSSLRGFKKIEKTGDTEYVGDFSIYLSYDMKKNYISAGSVGCAVKSTVSHSDGRSGYGYKDKHNKILWELSNLLRTENKNRNKNRNLLGEQISNYIGKRYIPGTPLPSRASIIIPISKSTNLPETKNFDVKTCYHLLEIQTVKISKTNNDQIIFKIIEVFVKENQDETLSEIVRVDNFNPNNTFISIKELLSKSKGSQISPKLKLVDMKDLPNDNVFYNS